MVDDWDQPELIDVSEPQTRAAMPADGDTRRTKSALGLALLCVFAVVGLTLIRAAGDAEPEPDPVEDVVADVTDDPDTSTTSEQTDTTSVHSNPRVFADGTRRVEDGDSFFEFETGWELFLGGYETDLISVPLDGSAQVTHDLRGMPIRAVGDWLVVGSRGKLSLLDLAQPDVTAQYLGPRTRFGLAELGSHLGPEENQVWLIGGEFNDLKWQLWEIGGEPNLITEVETVGSIFFGLPAHPELLSASSGGVFEIGPEQAERRIADGRLLAVTERHAVVQQCETPFDCEAVWLSRSSWDVDTSIVSPEGLSEPLWPLIQVTPDGERALVADMQGGAAALWNLATGEAEHENLRPGASLSPDGRYLASVKNNGSLVVIDLDTGEIAQAGGQRFHRYSQVVFVPAR